MVNNGIRLLGHLLPPKTLTKHNRKIGGPIYCLDQVKDAVRTHGVNVINDKASEDMVNEFTPPMEEVELCAFICALEDYHFHASEWCQTSVRMVIDCDSYSMKWDRYQLVEWEYGQEIYVKFGFREHHPVCIIVSAHPS